MFLREREIESFGFNGLRVRDYTENRRLRSSFMLVDVPPDQRHPRARPRKAEKIYCILAGRLRFEIDGESAVLEAGDAAVVRPGQVFAYRNESDTPARLALVWTPNFDEADEELLE